MHILAQYTSFFLSLFFFLVHKCRLFWHRFLFLLFLLFFPFSVRLWFCSSFVECGEKKKEIWISFEKVSTMWSFWILWVSICKRIVLRVLFLVLFSVLDAIYFEWWFCLLQLWLHVRRYEKKNQITFMLCSVHLECWYFFLKKNTNGNRFFFSEKSSLSCLSL